MMAALTGGAAACSETDADSRLNDENGFGALSVQSAGGGDEAASSSKSGSSCELPWAQVGALAGAAAKVEGESTPAADVIEQGDTEVEEVGVQSAPEDSDAAPRASAGASDACVSEPSLAVPAASPSAPAATADDVTAAPMPARLEPLRLGEGADDEAFLAQWRLGLPV